MLNIFRKFLKHKHLPTKPAQTGAKNHNVLDVVIYTGIRLTYYHNLIPDAKTLRAHGPACFPKFWLEAPDIPEK
jgi:hypothetical protein